MKEMFRYASILALIAAISGGSISAVVGVTSKVVEARKAEELKAALGTLLPAAESFKPVDSEGTIYYQGFIGEKPAGYVVTGKGLGYGGTIEVLVGFDDQGRIANVKIGSNKETAGIGTKVTENADFIAQFKDKNLKDPLAVGKDIQAVGGASRSSEGVAKAVKNAAEFLEMQVSGNDLTALIPTAEAFVAKEKDGIAYYQAEKAGTIVGYILTGSGAGYNGAIEASVAFDPQGSILNFQVNKHSETKKQASDVFGNTEFSKQFIGKTASDSLTLGQDIQAVSGASGTSGGLAAAIKNACVQMDKIK